jgi:hypothetical protein
LFAFREEKNGAIRYMFHGPLAFEKLPWYETMAVQTGFAIGFMLVFLITSLGIPIARWRRRRKGQNSLPDGRMLRFATWSSAFLNLIFLAGLSAVLMRMMRTGDFLGRIGPIGRIRPIRCARGAGSKHLHYFGIHMSAGWSPQSLIMSRQY